MTKKPPPDRPQDLVPDFAEDLLQTPTQILLNPGTSSDSSAQNSPPPESALPDSPDERFRNAKIFYNERMWDESKRVLHEILVSHPDHSQSRELLEKIRQAELKQILGSAPESLETTSSTLDLEPDAIREGLERELGLTEDPLERLSLIENLFSNLDQLLKELPISDLHELGASFLAAGLHGSAVRVLERVYQQSEALIHRSSALLLAQALILSGRPSRAVEYLEEVLQDTEVTKSEKIDFFYWMARAQILLREWDEAERWLREVKMDSPRYRDTDELLRMLGRQRDS